MTRDAFPEHGAITVLDDGRLIQGFVDSRFTTVADAFVGELVGEVHPRAAFDGREADRDARSIGWNRRAPDESKTERDQIGRFELQYFTGCFGALGIANHQSAPWPWIDGGAGACGGSRAP